MVSLRPYTADDLDVFAARLSGPEGVGGLQWFGYGSQAALEREFAQTGFLTADAGRLTVADGEQVLGRVQWFRDSWGPPAHSWCWEIGVLVLPEHRGRGVGTQAQVLLRDYLLDHTRAERIQASTDVQNLAEQRALDKAGFSREGLLRSAQWRGGRWHDQVLYSYVRSDRGAS